MEGILSPASVLSVAGRILPSSQSILDQTEQRIEMGGGEGRGEAAHLLHPDMSADADAQSQLPIVRRQVVVQDGEAAAAAAGGSSDTRTRSDSSPKKRVVMFSAFLACLSCVIILCNLVISFANDLLRDDAFLDVFQKYLKDQVERRNDSIHFPRVVV